MVMFMVVLAAFLKLVDYALSLSWIAAIILSIGMAVDANILIFERMNEEVNEWKTYLASIKSARKRSWSAIRDGQISTLLIWLLLFAYGINMFKWFGSMIILTALMTIFINVPFIEEMLETVYRGKKD
jgi:preprotein translocase subunit SecD